MQVPLGEISILSDLENAVPMPGPPLSYGQTLFVVNQICIHITGRKLWTPEISPLGPSFPEMVKIIYSTDRRIAKDAYDMMIREAKRRRDLLAGATNNVVVPAPPTTPPNQDECCWEDFQTLID